MSAVTIDTLELVKDLKAAGFTEPQAEAVTRAVKKAQDVDLSYLATKADLREQELHIIIKLGGMIFALGGILLAVKFFG